MYIELQHVCVHLPTFVASCCNFILKQWQKQVHHTSWRDSRTTYAAQNNSAVWPLYCHNNTTTSKACAKCTELTRCICWIGEVTEVDSSFPWIVVTFYPSPEHNLTTALGLYNGITVPSLESNQILLYNTTGMAQQWIYRAYTMETPGNATPDVGQLDRLDTSMRHVGANSIVEP